MTNVYNIILAQFYMLGIPIEIWAIIISIVALVFTLMKDFIIPLFKRPKLKFVYAPRSPFLRDCPMSGAINGCFLRFSIKNYGNRPAINCRCQIISINTKNGNPYLDYQGFPLNWAARPEKPERLNISRGETEFIDLVRSQDNSNAIFLESYHKAGIGIPSILDPGEYTITVLFSGDNFSPYKIKFQVKKLNTTNRHDITLSLIEITPYRNWC